MSNTQDQKITDAMACKTLPTVHPLYAAAISADGGTLGIDPNRHERIFLNRLMMFSGLTGDDLLEAVARHDASMPHGSLADERLCVICAYRTSGANWNAG